jgi:hypothetical protein
LGYPEDLKKYWDDPCKVKLDAKRGEFNEEVKCE